MFNAADLLNALGDPCSANVSGSFITFQGAFRTKFAIPTDDGLYFVENNPSIEVLTSIANSIALDSKVTVNSVQYVARQKYLLDEGLLTRIILAPVV